MFLTSKKKKIEGKKENYFSEGTMILIINSIIYILNTYQARQQKRRKKKTQFENKGYYTLRNIYSSILSQTKDFWREAQILSKLHHPNVVAFYGVVPDGPGSTLATVTEYMANGSLRHVLLKKDR